MFPVACGTPSLLPPGGIKGNYNDDYMINVPTLVHKKQYIVSSLILEHRALYIYFKFLPHKMLLLLAMAGTNSQVKCRIAKVQTTDCTYNIVILISIICYSRDTTIHT